MAPGPQPLALAAQGLEDFLLIYYVRNKEFGCGGGKKVGDAAEREESQSTSFSAPVWWRPGPFGLCALGGYSGGFCSLLLRTPVQ